MSFLGLKYSNILTPPDTSLNTCQHTKSRKLIFPEYNFTITSNMNADTLAESVVLSYIGHSVDDASSNSINDTEKYVVYKSLIHKLTYVLDIRNTGLYDLLYNTDVNNTIYVIDISRAIIGKRIKPNSIQLVHSGQTVIDARNTNEIYEDIGYLYLSGVQVGFVLYEYGILVITNSDTISTYPNIGLTSTDLRFQSSKEIDVHNVFVEIQPNRYNYTTNPTALHAVETSSTMYRFPVEHIVITGSNYIKLKNNVFAPVEISHSAKVFIGIADEYNIASFSGSYSSLSTTEYTKVLFAQPSIIPAGEVYVETPAHYYDVFNRKTYFTTVGLYNSDKQLVGLAKLPRSIPLKGAQSVCLNITFDTKTF